MKKFLFSILFLVITFESSLAVNNSSTTSSLPPEITDFTLLVSIRSLYSSDLVLNSDNPNDRYNPRIGLNWTPNQIVLSDKFTKKFPFGLIQFQTALDDQVCLAVDNRKKLFLDDCGKVAAGSYSTIFSLLPTSTAAVQILAVGGGNNMCLSTINPYAKLPLDVFGLKPCITNQEESIPLQNLFEIGPAFMPARLLAR